MHDAIELTRLIVLAGGLWNFAACAQGGWLFRKRQNAGTWLRAVIGFLSLGCSMFQFSVLILGNEGQSTIYSLFSLLVLAIGLTLGVWGERTGLFDQLDKAESLIENAAVCQAMADLAEINPEAAAAHAASIRAEIARRDTR